MQYKKRRNNQCETFLSISAKLIAFAPSGWLGYFLGGFDGMLIALIVFMVIDYVIYLMYAIATRNRPAPSVFGYP